MQLNLDSHFQPFINEPSLALEQFVFPGGEPHIHIVDQVKQLSEVNISHRIRSFNDIGILLVAVNALRNMGIKTIHLLLPYFPGARQDRLMQVGEALTVKVYADVINQLELSSVSIFDPHSEVAPALLNRCKVINNHVFIEQVLTQMNKDVYLVSPDGGALKKVHKLAAHLQDYEVIECSKSRDVKTGKLSGFKVYADDLQGKDCLIVDDICDGGGTFNGLAASLKKKNAGKLYLAVSHGIFSKGFDQLSQHFERIFCTNSFNDFTHEKLVQIDFSLLNTL